MRMCERAHVSTCKAMPPLPVKLLTKRAGTVLTLKRAILSESVVIMFGLCEILPGRGVHGEG